MVQMMALTGLGKGRIWTDQDAPLVIRPRVNQSAAPCLELSQLVLAHIIDRPSTYSKIFPFEESLRLPLQDSIDATTQQTSYILHELLIDAQTLLL